MGNTGVNACKSIPSVTKKDIFVLKYDSNGDLNKIASTDFVDGVLPDTFVKAQLNNADRSKRWYPTPKLYEEPTTAQAESIKQTFGSGTTIKIKNGITTFSGVIPLIEYNLIGQLEQAGCVELAKFTIDSDRNLIGKKIDDSGDLYPNGINADTLDVLPIYATETTVSQISISYEYLQSENVANLRMIPADKIETNMLAINGLIDAYGKVEGTPSTSQFDFKIWSESGKLGGNGIKGAILTSFVFSQAPTSLTYVGDGVYSALGTFTTGVVNVSQAVSQLQGYELEPFTITIP